MHTDGSYNGILSAAMKKYYLTIDLGASNGRGIVFSYDGQRLETVWEKRFKNTIVTRAGTDYWDLPYLLSQVKRILGEAAKAYPIRSFSIDTWGLDFGLLDREGKLLRDPVSYRDRRTEGIPEKLAQVIEPRRMYQITGIQKLQGNTINQLYAMALTERELLERAGYLLMMPDLLTYFLTGVMASEYTISTTTQLMDVSSQTWSGTLLEKLGLGEGLLQRIVYPGEQAWPLLPELRRELGLPEELRLVTAASHDTASAVIAVPAREERYLYVSSGTWSVLGTELPRSVICDEGFRANFTNEGGFGGTVRYCRSLIGLWMIQECVRVWEGRGERLSYGQLDSLAREAEPFRFRFDPEAPEVQIKCDMPATIARLCRERDGEGPEDYGSVCRTIYECMAFHYRRTVDALEKQTGDRFQSLYIVGGGTRAEFLNQCIANATGKTVVVGPAEATAYGNVFAQLYFEKELAGIRPFRELLRRQEEMKTYFPRDRERWESAYGRFLAGGSEEGEPV